MYPYLLTCIFLPWSPSNIVMGPTCFEKPFFSNVGTRHGVSRLLQLGHRTKTIQTHTRIAFCGAKKKNQSAKSRRWWLDLSIRLDPHKMLSYCFGFLFGGVAFLAWIGTVWWQTTQVWLSLSVLITLQETCGRDLREDWYGSKFKQEYNSFYMIQNVIFTASCY